MISFTKIPFQPIFPNPKPTSNHHFSWALVNPNLGFGKKLNDSKKMDFLRNFASGCFKGQSSSSKEERKVEIESCVNDGGEDVFDAESKVQPDHLVIMVNGIIGSASDWRYGAEQFVMNHPDKVIVHRSESNASMLTFDGVDRMGERLADEVMNVIRRWPGVRKISFVAHSLGGLVARYAIGRLYKQSVKTQSTVLSENCNNGEVNIEVSNGENILESSIGGLEPMNFVTFATPHLGSRGHKQLPLLCGLPFLERSASQTAHWIAGRSGKHLFLTDDDDGRPPLLLRMVNDCEDIHFISALRAFKRRVAYANANFDHVVGWRTSSIRRKNELPKSNLLVQDMKYPHIAHVERRLNDEQAIKASSTIRTQVMDLEEEMIRGLNQVSWERIDVSFQKSTQRYAAHTTIQVKTYWLNSDGADVVQHMIDNFLL